MLWGPIKGVTSRDKSWCWSCD